MYESTVHSGLLGPPLADILTKRKEVNLWIDSPRKKLESKL
jgi:hypothetical protein